MDIENLIRKIIIDILNEQKKEINDFDKKKCLVLITGGNKEKDEILLSLKKISEKFSMKYAFSDMGIKIIGKHHFSNDDIIDNFSIENISDLISTFDILFIPFLTKNSCAKFINGINDTPSTYIITKSLIEKKRVIATFDSCKPLGSSYFENILLNNIKVAEKLGVEFIHSKDIKNYFLDGDNIIRIQKNKKLLTRLDVINYKNKKIFIPKTTTITSLAKDTLDENNCFIEFYN